MCVRLLNRNGTQFTGQCTLSAYGLTVMITREAALMLE